MDVYGDLDLKVNASRARPSGRPDAYKVSKDVVVAVSVA
jgi:hypothetical protein